MTYVAALPCILVHHHHSFVAMIQSCSKSTSNITQPWFNDSASPYSYFHENASLVTFSCSENPNQPQYLALTQLAYWNFTSLQYYHHEVYMTNFPSSTTSIEEAFEFQQTNINLVTTNH